VTTTLEPRGSHYTSSLFTMNVRRGSIQAFRVATGLRVPRW
jgi:hypothetical protein